MRILDRSVYVGPSLYAHFPVIRLDLDLGPLEEWPTGRLGRLHRRASSRRCPGWRTWLLLRRAGRLPPPLPEDEGTWLGHVLEHVAIELQNAAGEQVTFGKTRSADRPAIPRRLRVRAGGRGARGRQPGDHACCIRLLPERARGRPGVDARGAFDFRRSCEAFIRFAQRRDLGPSTASLVHAAEARGIPWIRLNEHSLIQFGHGRLPAADPGHDHEPHPAHRGRAGLRQGRDQQDPGGAGAAGAAAAAGARARRTRSRPRPSIGYPVVVKPYNANHGRGVAIHLTEMPSRCALRSRWRSSTAAA